MCGRGLAMLQKALVKCGEELGSGGVLGGVLLNLHERGTLILWLSKQGIRRDCKGYS